MSFENYMKKKSDVESAYNLYNYASTKLELEKIRCRLAEIESQAEPLESICGDNKNRRSDMLKVAFYVVVGRFPEDKETK